MYFTQVKTILKKLSFVSSWKTIEYLDDQELALIYTVRSFNKAEIGVLAVAEL